MPRYEYEPPETLEGNIHIEGPGVAIDAIGTYDTGTGKLVALHLERHILAPRNPDAPFAYRGTIRVEREEINLPKLIEALAGTCGDKWLTHPALDELIAEHEAATLGAIADAAYDAERMAAE